MKQLDISDTTIREITHIIFPVEHEHTKLAESAVEFFLNEMNYVTNPNVDMKSIRAFIGYLIKFKGYN